jgi:hypothetical protein
MHIYIKSLEFYETPNYSYLKALLVDILRTQNILMNSPFGWSNWPAEASAVSNKKPHSGEYSCRKEQIEEK